MKKFRKGNALLFTVIILFTISTIATALTMYFYRANLIAKNSNAYFEKHLELSNEMNATYKVILENNDNNDFGLNLHSKVDAISSNEKMIYTALINNYLHTFSYEPSSGGVRKCKYTIENTVKNKVYTLERVLLIDNNSCSFDVGEVYYVNVSN